MGACGSKQTVADAPAATAKPRPLHSAAATQAHGCSISNGTPELSSDSLGAFDGTTSNNTTTPPQPLPPLPLPTLPRDTEERLAAVRVLRLPGKAPEPRLDLITSLVKQLFDTPISAVVLIDENLQFMSSQGELLCSGQRGGSSRDWLFALDAPSLLVVEDAAQDARFKDAAYVAGQLPVGFYAGAPLVSSVDGHRYGTLCVIDFRPRTFPPDRYQMLCHFSEICVRELEQALALQWQQQAADTRLRRAIEGFHEGIALLDLSSAGWRMLHCNDALRAAAGMPQLLAGATTRGSGGADEEGASAADFWSVFGHVSDGANGSHKAALAAMVAGQEFALSVRPSGSVASSSGQAPVLRVVFKPADSEQPQACTPAGGIPMPAGAVPAGWPVDSSSGVGGPAGGARDGSSRPQYYFGIVQAVEKQVVPLARLPSSTGSGSMHGWFPSAVEAGRGEGSAQGGSIGSAMRRDLSQPLLSQCDSSGVLPSFFAMRPEVMSEVVLGPLIGSGSAGRCYRAQWQGGRVAVKIIDCKFDPEAVAGGALSPASPWDASCLDDALGSQKPAAEAALVEALLARSLSHPHILTTYCHAATTKLVHSSGEWRQQVWIIQEFCARGSLLQAIDSGVLKLPNGAPNLPAILTAAQEIAGACLYLHRHDIVHGDLTPGNVLLATSSRDARRWVCKVGDFGLAQIIHPDATEIYSSCFGTLTHAAPELVVEGMLTKAADVFSFGVILLEMYSSKRVWRGYSFMQILSAISEGKLPFVIPADCPEALASLLHRCLHTDPMQRPTFDVVLAEVQAMLRGVPRAMGAGAPPQPTSVSVRGPSSPAGPQPAPKHESPFAQAAVTRAGSGPLITMSEPHA